MIAEGFTESRARSFVQQWSVCADYSIVRGYVIPADSAAVGEAATYMPMARPELPGELAKVRTEPDVLKFVREYGLLGWTDSWRLFRELPPNELDQVPEPLHEQVRRRTIDPVAWILGHARTARLLLRLIGRLDDERHLRVEIDRLTITDEHGQQNVDYVYAARGSTYPNRGSLNPEEPARELALWIIGSTVNRNLAGSVSRALMIERPENEQPRLVSMFTPGNLADCIYWHLADAAAGGWVRRCADPKCGAFFVAQSARVKYCPPPHGVGESQCLNRYRQQRFRDSKKGEQ